MATDSSSGTLPSSSRRTIVSSSSIARSKDSFLTSAWVFSAICAFPDAPRQGAESNQFLRTYCGGDLAGHQCGDVFRYRLFQPLQVVAALQHRDNPPLRAGIGGVHQLARDPAEILGLDVERGQRIAVMRVEAGRNDDQLGAEFLQLRQNQVFECRAEFGAA